MMGRTPRKTKLEILEAQLTTVRESIDKKEQELKELKSKEKGLKSELKKYQYEEISTLIEESNMSVEDVKALLVQAKIANGI